MKEESKVKPSYRTGYSNPYFDFGSLATPPEIKQLFRWCRYFYMMDPIVHAVIQKKAEYPVTNLIFETEEQALKERYEHLAEDILDIRAFLVEVGLDQHTYGTAFVSVMFPFVKYLTCSSCGAQFRASDVRQHYSLKDGKFYLKCPKCGISSYAKVSEIYVKDVDQIRLIRWNPEHIDIKHSPITGKTIVLYRPPAKDAIALNSRKEFAEETPQIFLEAIYQNRMVEFDQDAVFILRRPIISRETYGWGMPAILPVFKLLYYLQILRKANEMIAREHMIPLRVMFPQTSSPEAPVFTTVDLTEWESRVRTEIEKWRRDPNHIPLLPLPLGYQAIGGQGRALSLHQEIRIVSEQIVAGLGVPNEFIFGGLSYSGTNVSLKMLENDFLNDRRQKLKLVNWIFRRIANYLGWPKVSIRFAKFRMADDMQRAMFAMQLKQAGFVSTQYLAEHADFNYEVERRRIRQETIDKLEAQKDYTLLQSEAQILGQAEAMRYKRNFGGLASSGRLGGATYKPEHIAYNIAQRLKKLPADIANKELEHLKTSNPELHQLVTLALNQFRSEREPTDAIQSPEPEVKAPRRQEA